MDTPKDNRPEPQKRVDTLTLADLQAMLNEAKKEGWSQSQIDRQVMGAVAAAYEGKSPRRSQA